MSTHVLTLSGSLGFGTATILGTQFIDPTAIRVSSVRRQFYFVDGTSLSEGAALLVGPLYLCVAEFGAFKFADSCAQELQTSSSWGWTRCVDY